MHSRPRSSNCLTQRSCACDSVVSGLFSCDGYRVQIVRRVTFRQDSVACGLYRQMSREHTTPEMWGNLEYPACPLCGSERREFPFHLHEPYSVARCTACGFHYLYPGLSRPRCKRHIANRRITKTGRAGMRIRVTLRRSRPYARRSNACCATLHGLTGGDLLEIGCSSGLLRGRSLLLMLTSRLSGTILPRVRYVYSTGRENFPWPECFTKTFAGGLLSAGTNANLTHG